MGLLAALAFGAVGLCVTLADDLPTVPLPLITEVAASMTIPGGGYHVGVTVTHPAIELVRIWEWRVYEAGNGPRALIGSFDMSDLNPQPENPVRVSVTRRVTQDGAYQYGCEIGGDSEMVVSVVVDTWVGIRYGVPE